MPRISDVIVIGAGIIGSAVACELARRGARVHVIDPRGSAGQGATRASAGMLVPYLEGHPSGPLRELGVCSLRLYDGFVSELVEEAGQPIEYERRGSLEVAVDEESAGRMKASVAHLASGGVGAQFLDRQAVREHEPQLAADVFAGILVPDHGYVVVRDLVGALMKSAVGRGAALEAAYVTRIVTEGAAVRVETSTGTTFAAGTVVLAAGSWSGRIPIAIGEGGGREAASLPVRPVRGQLLQLEWPDRRLAHIVWGPDCYVVPWKADGTAPSSVLVGATMEEAGFDERATAAGVRDLLDAACGLLPEAWRAGFAEVRVGLRPATPDALPVVGRSARSPALVYATGHYRNGVLLAPLTARLVGDLVIEGREDPALRLVAPDRFLS
jgi:glycine oxidase